METKFNEILSKVKNGIAIEESINTRKKAKASSKGLQNNILEKQAEEMLNNTRMLKDDLNAMYLNTKLRENLKQNNNKISRNALKFHNKIQNKKEQALFNKYIDDEDANLTNNYEGSLIHLLKFILSYIINVLEQSCPKCKKVIFGSDKDIKICYDKLDFDMKNKDKSVMVVPCGHFFHFDCLDEFITCPPWDNLCKCGEEVFHDLWPYDVAIYQKQFAHRQSQVRQTNELDDFMSDLGI